MKSYDISFTPGTATRNDEGIQGWCFGLPPGISTQRWPMDPNSGYPLLHGFTLKIPDDWREELSGLFALSFFATAPDHNDGGPAETEGLYELISKPGDTAPEDPELLPLWEHARKQHPKLHRMLDILECEYAVIPLTEEEFRGPFTQPPLELVKKISSKLEVDQPAWLESGAAYSFGRPYSELESHKFLETYVGKMLGRIPQQSLEEHFLFTLQDRQDPNSGKQPVEIWEGDVAANGYENIFITEDDSYDLKEWAKDLGANHLGGTMRPIQSYPEVSACYIEFEEHFGGYNFGGGNAQLCLQSFLFDWACG